MFDIGFPELVVVSIVALVVIGPDKLPETVRTIMLWIGRIKNGFASIKKELEQELGTDEIRQQLHNESIMKELAKTRSQIDEVIESASEGFKGLKESTDLELANEIKQSASDKDAATPSIEKPKNPQT